MSEEGTSTTLLEAVRAKSPFAWDRFAGLYSPVVFGWCRRAGLQYADALDVSQEVFRTVSTAIHGFRRDATAGTFRGWLRAVTRTRLADHRRRARAADAGAGGSDAQARLAGLADDAEEPDARAERADDVLLLRRAIQIVLEDSAEQTRKAFTGVELEGRPVAAVAADLGVTANVVYLAVHRVKKRLREEFAGLIDLSPEEV